MTYRPGTIRYKNDDGTHVVSSPRDASYSTVTMLATEYWDEAEGWLPIHEDDEDASS